KMRFLRALSVLLCCSLSSAQTLDPGGRNVCKDSRDSSTLLCCTGWRQQGKECTIALCEGEQMCLENEICVFPGVCRCPPGYYGAQCKTRCPPEFWASDCRQVCPCYPHGHCNAVTGECTCNPTRWGPLCQNTCKCTRNGHCHPVMGNCICDEGWWSPTCSKPCQCSSIGSLGSSCDPLTGRCQCRRGYWGIRCQASCNCNQSPCNERTGVCECEAGSWGSSCDRKCNCDLLHSSCDPVSGQCLCQPGYTGVSCNHPCKAGDYGSSCNMRCGHCKDNQPCSSTDGACAACEPGWNGTRCDRPCASGWYGDGCRDKCPKCWNNEPCDPITGKCLRFFIYFTCFCLLLCCGRVAVAEGGLLVRMKYHVYSVLANIGAALPCMSDWSSGLPRVTVSHHDPELTFNHSFIEPPSSGWVDEGSSFDSDEEEGESLYCVPPREGRTVAGGEFQEMSSKCNMFLDPSGFSNEDITSSFNIPRTSSIAKSKRPSVSFAEGTRFSPKERRGSGQDPGGPSRGKAKTPWGVLMLSALQSQGGTDQEVDSNPSYANLQVPGTSGRRRTMSNTAGLKGTPPPTSDGEVGASHKLTTVYVTVGKAGRPVTKPELSSEGPVQAMLRRLGSLQRQREQDGGKSKSKPVEGITKPPRRKLGARAAVWEQGGPSGAQTKPIRQKNVSEAPPLEGNTPKRPLSSILKSVPELAAADCGSTPRAEGAAVHSVNAGVEQTESSYLTVGPAGEAAEIISNQEAAHYEPCYENVLITQP
uniref:Scavenger receptor class F, member 1 n=1 Tax=Cyprinodon variegatus TaxID=28743 RepID=A0A3Q2CRK6_CYPVA